MKLSSSKIKTFLTFFQENLFLFSIFYSSFQEMELSTSKIKKFLIFSGMELSSFIFYLYFRREHSELAKEKEKTL